jgi:predicted naringenin-chalcone synthase
MGRTAEIEIAIKAKEDIMNRVGNVCSPLLIFVINTLVHDGFTSMMNDSMESGYLTSLVRDVNEYLLF